MSKLQDFRNWLRRASPFLQLLQTAGTFLLVGVGFALVFVASNDRHVSVTGPVEVYTAKDTKTPLRVAVINPQLAVHVNNTVDVDVVNDPRVTVKNTSPIPVEVETDALYPVDVRIVK